MAHALAWAWCKLKHAPHRAAGQHTHAPPGRIAGLLSRVLRPPSIIGAARINFSVRNGMRRNPRVSGFSNNLLSFALGALVGNRLHKVTSLVEILPRTDLIIKIVIALTFKKVIWPIYSPKSDFLRRPSSFSILENIHRIIVANGRIPMMF